MQIRRKAVGDVDAGSDLVELAESGAEPKLGLGIEMPSDSRRGQLALGVRQRARRLDRPSELLQQEQPGRRSADGPADVDAVAGSGAAPQQRMTANASDGGDSNGQLVSTGEIAPNQIEFIGFRGASHRPEER